jgi:Fic family protein
MRGVEVTIEWDGRPATAWSPALLSARTGELDELSETTVRCSERAGGEVRRVGDRLPAGIEPLARLLLRAEGVASSNIEGLHADPAAIAMAELHTSGDATAAWVSKNLLVVEEALAHAASSQPLEHATLHRWHRTLMQGSPLAPHLVGRYRDAQGWIGGTSPRNAVYVPPPPELVLTLMDDLLEFVAADHDPIAQAAVAHAQLETIHPYGDGNGRIGRVLVLWLIARRLDVAVPPATSVLIARDPGGYLSGLHSFRTDPVDRWVRWFARIVEHASQRALEWTAEVDDVLRRWRAATADLRADAAAHRIIDELPHHPVLDVATTARLLDTTTVTARTALRQLDQRGVLVPWEAATTVPGRPRAWWAATDLLDLVGGWAS